MSVTCQLCFIMTLCGGEQVCRGGEHGGKHCNITSTHPMRPSKKRNRDVEKSKNYKHLNIREPSPMNK